MAPRTRNWAARGPAPQFTHFFTKLGADDIRRNTRQLADYRGQLDAIQIDDGFERRIGDWLEPDAGFPDGVAPLAAEIRDAGFRAGLWLAPVPRQRFVLLGLVAYLLVILGLSYEAHWRLAWFDSGNRMLTHVLPSFAWMFAVRGGAIARRAGARPLLSRALAAGPIELVRSNPPPSPHTEKVPDTT